MSAVDEVMENIMVTKEDFLRYVEVQNSGVCNMLSDDVQTLAGLTKAQHLYIIGHYSELAIKYSEVYRDDTN